MGWLVQCVGSDLVVGKMVVLDRLSFFPLECAWCPIVAHFVLHHIPLEVEVAHPPPSRSPMQPFSYGVLLKHHHGLLPSFFPKLVSLAFGLAGLTSCPFFGLLS